MVTMSSPFGNLKKPSHILTMDGPAICRRLWESVEGRLSLEFTIYEPYKNDSLWNGSLKWFYIYIYTHKL